MSLIDKTIDDVIELCRPYTWVVTDAGYIRRLGDLACPLAVAAGLDINSSLSPLDYHAAGMRLGLSITDRNDFVDAVDRNVIDYIMDRGDGKPVIAQRRVIVRLRVKILAELVVKNSLES